MFPDLFTKNKSSAIIMVRTNVLKWQMEEETPMKRKYRIKSKFRFTLFISLVLVMVLLTTGTVLGLNRSNGIGTPAYITVEIQSGDTLWELASQFGPDGTDPRKVVKEICRINGISADQLRPGQEILIPEFI